MDIIKEPKVIKACGNKPKVIEEFIGRVNSQTSDVSIARMKSPSGWEEPCQKPEFDEYTLVLKGVLRVKTENQTVDINANEAIISPRGQWVQYSTQLSKISIKYEMSLVLCLFSLAHRL